MPLFTFSYGHPFSFNAKGRFLFVQRSLVCPSPRRDKPSPNERTVTPNGIKGSGCLRQGRQSALFECFVLLLRAAKLPTLRPLRGRSAAFRKHGTHGGVASPPRLKILPLVVFLVAPTPGFVSLIRIRQGSIDPYAAQKTEIVFRACYPFKPSFS